MKPNIKILDRIFLGRDTEVILIQHEEGFEVSIGIQKLQNLIIVISCIKTLLMKKKREFLTELGRSRPSSIGG